MNVRSIPTATLFGALLLFTVIAALGLQVNPWPRDGWYQTQYFLVGDFWGQDDYAPIAAPAFFFWIAHQLAAVADVGLAGEFYIASVMQNVLVFLGAVFIYDTFKKLCLEYFAAIAATVYLLAILATALAQAFWSENVVLFLMAALLWTLAVLLGDTRSNSIRISWWHVVLCALLIALLVVTRVIPVLLIPGIALLFFRRMPAAKFTQLIGVTIALTAVAIVGTVIANHARFGRYELSNSSGRHLWQGVRDFSDSALADNLEYQTLKKLQPNLQGTNWWDVLMPPDAHGPSMKQNAWLLRTVPTLEQEQADPSEAILGRLAKQAILHEPLTYLLHGAQKFFATIGTAPYRLGYTERGGWDALRREEFLPSAAVALHLSPQFSAAAERFYAAVYAAFEVIYPVTIVAIVTSYFAVLLGRAEKTSIGRDRAILFFLMLLGVVLALLPIATNGWSRKAALASGISILLVLAQARLWYRYRSSLRREFHQAPDVDSRLFSFSMLMFFGSLWLSWQLESSSPRNAIPYLPFWVLMLGLAADYWRQTGLCLSKR